MDGASRPSSVVRFEGVTRRFGDTVALSDVDLDIEPGRIVGVDRAERSREDHRRAPDDR